VSAIVFSLFWISVCVWASFVIAGRVNVTGNRIAYYLLIWLVPYIGAVAAILLTRRKARINGRSASEKMFDVIVDSHRQERSG